MDPTASAVPVAAATAANDPFDEDVSLNDMYNYCFKPVVFPDAVEVEYEGVFESTACTTDATLSPYGVVATPFVYMFGESCSQFLMRLAYTNAHTVAPNLLVRPYASQANFSITAKTVPDDFRLVLGGRLGLNKVIGSYESFEKFGLKWHVQAGSHGQVSGDCCVPGWLVPTVPIKDKASATLELKAREVKVKYNVSSGVMEEVTDDTGGIGCFTLTLMELVPRAGIAGKTMVVLTRASSDLIVQLGKLEQKKRKAKDEPTLVIGGSAFIADNRPEVGDGSKASKKKKKDTASDAFKHLLR